MKLDTDSLSLLSSSSAKGVALSMRRVAAGLSDGHWLSPSNRYRRQRNRGGNNRLKDDLSNNRVYNNELGEYIGVSAPVHSLDGWSFLGRSIHCLARGDPYNAVHLAYYAELRAALAMLATEGVGVFGYPHCVIDSSSICSIVKPVDEEGNRVGTHQWAWLAFQWWAQQPRAVELLRKVIRPGGRPLGAWVEAMTKARFALRALGPSWLQLWGIDIRRYFADRDARNAASYWPNTINNWKSRSAAENYRAISHIWMPLEPTSEARFAELDKHLLRLVLTQGYINVSGHAITSQTGRKGFDREVEALLSNVGMNYSGQSSWQHFLTDARFGEPPVIEMANGTAKVGKKTHVAEVMCRATMLLRLATGASAMLLSDAGIERQHLEFWIQAVGTERGIWQPKKPPEAMIDLWADVEYELERIDDWAYGPEPSLQDLWAAQSRGLTVLGECERVALWGLGL